MQEKKIRSKKDRQLYRQGISSNEEGKKSLLFPGRETEKWDLGISISYAIA